MVRFSGTMKAAWVAMATVVLGSATAQGQLTNTSFQQGVDGYQGTFERLISEDSTRDKLGAEYASYYVDGYSTGGSLDEQNLIRFMDIVGNGHGQIPEGATILDATFTLTTSLAGSAQTSGPYGVAALSQPFSGSTTYFDFSSGTDFGSRGPWWQDGYSSRPLNGFGFQIQGQPDSTDITSFVQNWVDVPASNYGLVVQAGLSDTASANANTSDGWSTRTTGFPFTDSRPKLDVTYTTSPVTVTEFQRDLNGYNSDTMAFVRSGPNALLEDTIDGEITEDAQLFDQAFLDGVFFTDSLGNNTSPDDFALVKFDNLFGNGAGQAPSDVPVAKAWLVMTTGDQSNAAPSRGPWSAYQMLRDWNTNTLHSDFGAQNGLQVSDGDISEALSTLDGFIRGSEVWFDVTDYAEAVRNGAANYGLGIAANGTSDGWQIHTNGSSELAARPRLKIYSADLGLVNSGLAGDFNDDGVVDAADYTIWRDALGTDNPLAGNGNELGASNGIVDLDDYVLWQNNFGQFTDRGPLLAAGSEAAVPEPGTLCLLIFGMASLAAGRKRS